MCRKKIARFERVEDLPIHVGILIDNSASMVGTLGEVRKAALSFFEQAITPRDRAAVITLQQLSPPGGGTHQRPHRPGWRPRRLGCPKGRRRSMTA